MDNCLKTINFWTFGNTPYVMNHPNMTTNTTTTTTTTMDNQSTYLSLSLNSIIFTLTLPVQMTTFRTIFVNPCTTNAATGIHALQDRFFLICIKDFSL